MREGSLTMLTQRKLSNVLGSAIEGIDLSRELADAEFCVLARALWEGGVLAIKGQRLAPGQFLAFARRFGRPEPHVINQFHYPGYPDILILSNRRNNGEPIGLADAGSYFHTDYSYLKVPARLTMLYSIEVPSRGGDTLFANMSAAYDDLAESMKRRIDHLVVLHHYGNRDDLDEDSRTDTYPYIRIDENDVDIGHEATVSKIGEEQLFYLMSRGLSEAEAAAMIVSGFVEPITKELPLEYAVEMNRLIQLQMEGSVG